MGYESITWVPWQQAFDYPTDSDILWMSPQKKLNTPPQSSRLSAILGYAPHCSSILGEAAVYPKARAFIRIPVPGVGSCR